MLLTGKTSIDKTSGWI